MILNTITTVLVSTMLVLPNGASAHLRTHVSSRHAHRVSNTRSAQRLLSETPPTVLDFSNYTAGEVVTDLGDGITVCVAKFSDDGMVDGQGMIFDSVNVTGGDDDLGTPHQSFGGPGIGIGGKAGKLYENDLPRGNVLIISTDENANAPNDHATGGVMMFTFDPPRDIDSVGLLDNEDGVVFMTCTKDGDVSLTLVEDSGNNSFEQVSIGKPQVTNLFVAFSESGGITDIQFGQRTVCVDGSGLDSLAAGTTPTNLDGGVIALSAFDLTGTPKEAMVFDSSSPTGDDLDLGSPNESFGGPGVGRKGVKGRLFENNQAKGNLLIVSEDGDSSDPDDNADGGVLVFDFDPPRDIDSVGLLDNEGGTLFEVTGIDGSSTFVWNENGGDNSFEAVALTKKQVTRLVIHFAESGAISDISSCP